MFSVFFKKIIEKIYSMFSQCLRCKTLAWNFSFFDNVFMMFTTQTLGIACCVYSSKTNLYLHVVKIGPPNVFIGTVGPDLGSADRLAPQSLGSMHTESDVRGYLSYYSSWGT